MNIYFEIKGVLKAKSIDDAINTLEMMQDDYDIHNVRLEISGSTMDDESPRFDIDIIATGRSKECKEK